MGDHFTIDCDCNACPWVIIAGGGNYDFVGCNFCVCHVFSIQVIASYSPIIVYYRHLSRDLFNNSGKKQNSCKSLHSKGLRRSGGAPPPQKSSPIFDKIRTIPERYRTRQGYHYQLRNRQPVSSTRQPYRESSNPEHCRQRSRGTNHH